MYGIEFKEEQTLPNRLLDIPVNALRTSEIKNIPRFKIGQISFIELWHSEVVKGTIKRGVPNPKQHGE
jgi:hypothetical protein